MDGETEDRGKKFDQLDKCTLNSIVINIIFWHCYQLVGFCCCFCYCAYRQWLVGLFVLLLRYIQMIYEALQLLPEGLHLSIDTIQQLMLPDPVMEERESF